MSQPRIKIPRQSDSKLIRAFRTLCVDVNAAAFHAYPYAWEHTVNISKEGDLPEEIRSVVNSSSMVLRQFGVGVPGLSVNLYRGGLESGSEFSPSAMYDELVIGQSGQTSLTAAQLLPAIDKLQRTLLAFDPKRSTELSGEEALGQLAALHSTTLDRLEQVNVQLLEDQQKHRQQLEREYADKLAEAEAKSLTRSDALTSAVEAKESAIGEREAQLQRRLADIDDRDNTHARRELRKDLQSEIKSRSAGFRLSKETQALRSPITIVFVALITLLVLGAFWYGFEFAELIKSKTTETWLMVFVGAKQAAFSIATVATSYFYIRWLNHWSETHAISEFELRRLQLDVDRASWVVETAFEWKASQNAELPNELLQSISRGLFEGSKSQPHELASPADELASALLGSASKVTLKSGETNATVEIDGKGLKNLQKTS